MCFNEKMKEISSKIKNNSKYINTIDDVKYYSASLLLSGLGFDVHNPEDVVVKNDSNANYILFIRNYPVMAVKCCTPGSNLKSISENWVLKPCKYGIVTNGIEYRFCEDKDGKIELVHVFDVTRVNEVGISNMEKFKKENLSYNPEDEVYKLIMVNVFQELTDPSDDFVGYFVNKLPSHLKNSGVDFKEGLSRALAEYSGTTIDEFLEDLGNVHAEHIDTSQLVEEGEVKGDLNSEEWGAYTIIKGVVDSLQSQHKVLCKKTKQYIGVYLENTNKTVCRFHFGARKKGIAFPLMPIPEKGIKNFTSYYDLNKVEDILKYKNTFEDIIISYL